MAMTWLRLCLRLVLAPPGSSEKFDVLSNLMRAVSDRLIDVLPLFFKEDPFELAFSSPTVPLGRLLVPPVLLIFFDGFRFEGEAPRVFPGKLSSISSSRVMMTRLLLWEEGLTSPRVEGLLDGTNEGCPKLLVVSLLGTGSPSGFAPRAAWEGVVPGVDLGMEAPRVAPAERLISVSTTDVD